MNIKADLKSHYRYDSRIDYFSLDVSRNGVWVELDGTKGKSEVFLTVREVAMLVADLEIAAEASQNLNKNP